MTEPGSEPDPREFYDARPKFETRPEDDPPMTVRVESWERRTDPQARRVIRTDWFGDWPWILVTGDLIGANLIGATRGGIHHDALRDWPVVHPLHYTVAFRHAQTFKRLEQAVTAGPDHDCAFGHNCELNGWPLGKPERGDMGVEAFRG